MSIQRAQFSLRALLLVTGFLAVVFALLAQRNGHVVVFPLVTLVLSLTAVFGRRIGWQHAFGAWAAVAGIAALIDLELASGYGATVPLVGRIPGPPSRICEFLIRASIWFAIGLGLWQTFLGVKYGNRLAKYLLGSAGLLLLAPAWLLLRGNGHVTALPVAILVLLCAGAISRTVHLRCGYWSWAAVAFSAALLDLELASRHRWNLPAIGRMPGPPSTSTEGFIAIIIGLTIALGLWQAVAGARSARLLSRAACWIAGFALLFEGMLYIVVLDHNGPAIAFTSGAFALIAAGIATRRWLCRDRGAALKMKAGASKLWP